MAAASSAVTTTQVHLQKRCIVRGRIKAGCAAEPRVMSRRGCMGVSVAVITIYYIPPSAPYHAPQTHSTQDAEEDDNSVPLVVVLPLPSPP